MGSSTRLLWAHEINQPEPSARALQQLELQHVGPHQASCDLYGVLINDGVEISLLDAICLAVHQKPSDSVLN